MRSTITASWRLVHHPVVVTRPLRRPCCRQRRCFHESPPRLAFLPQHQPIREYTVVDAGDVLTEAVRPSFERQEPLVLRDLLRVTPLNRLAMNQFAKWDFWSTVVDETTDCHVELGGGNYASPESQPADVPFAEFVAYMRQFEERGGRSPPPGGATGGTSDSDLTIIYLAQNDLFPEIYPHVELPALTETLGEQRHRYSTMLWMGPYGCVSPLHYDPLDNLFLQFVGTKQFLLCPPGSQVPKGMQPNTSSWDPYTQKEIPEVALQHALLRPGDALYMPKKWYHHVQTLETSVSINTWFR